MLPLLYGSKCDVLLLLLLWFLWYYFYYHFYHNMQTSDMYLSVWEDFHKEMEIFFSNVYLMFFFISLYNEMYVCQISTPFLYRVYYSIGVFWIASEVVRVFLWCQRPILSWRHVLVVKDYIQGYHSKKITTNFLKNIWNTLFIKDRNVVGALVKPNGITKYSKLPPCVLNEVLYSSPACILTRGLQ